MQQLRLLVMMAGRDRRARNIIRIAYPEAPQKTTMRAKLMSREEIQAELGWTDKMIYGLLGEPDSDSVRRVKGTGGYTRGLYLRERVLMVAQSPEALLAEKRWAQTVHGHHPAPGWTMRLGDIGHEVGITARAVGKILNLMGFRSNRQITDHAVAVGCGVRRWDGDRFHIDWHVDRMVEAIRTAAVCPDYPAVAEALATAVAKQQATALQEGRRLRQQEAEAAQRRERQAMMAVLKADLIALMSSAPDLTILEAVEFVTPDPGDRLALYRAFENADHNAGRERVPPRSSTASDLALLERRAEVAGFHIIKQR